MYAACNRQNVKDDSNFVSGNIPNLAQQLKSVFNHEMFKMIQEKHDFNWIFDFR